MIGLDTNVLCRYLLADDPDQTEVAAEIIEGPEDCFVAQIVLCELVWVLETSEKLGRDRIVQTLRRLLHARGMVFEDRGLAMQALDRYEEGTADLADLLIGARGAVAGCERTVTFDRALGDEDGFEVLR